MASEPTPEGAWIARSTPEMDLGAAASIEDEAQDHHAQSDDIKADRSDKLAEQTGGDEGTGAEDEIGASSQGQNQRVRIEGEEVPYLPNEVWLKILRQLPLCDIKALRLACHKPWTELGAGLLFPRFVFRPDRFDFERFHDVSKHPLLLDGISEVRFEIGAMDLYHMVKQLSLRYANEYNESLLNYPHGITHTKFIKEMKDMAVREYAVWNDDWDTAQQSYKDPSTLREVFQKIPKLRKVSVTRRSCTFESAMLCDAFIEGTDIFEFEGAAQEFLAILKALSAMPECKLETLIHDQIPVTLFNDQGTLFRKIPAESFKHLVILELGLEATMSPRRSVWRGLGPLLKSAIHLKELKFGFDPFDRYTKVAPVWSMNKEEPKNWYLPLWKLLDSHTWPGLRSLCLDGLLVCETGLIDLLARHASTLRTLNLNTIGLWEGSYRGLLTQIRSTLQLTDFQIYGRLRAFHSPDEQFNKILPALMYVSCPTSPTIGYFAARSIGPPGEPLASPDCGPRLRHFVLEGGAWPTGPMLLDTGMTQTPPDESPHSVNCTDCAVNRAQIDKEWPTAADLGGWEDIDSDAEDADEEEENPAGTEQPGVESTTKPDVPHLDCSYEMDDVWDNGEGYDLEGFDYWGLTREDYEKSDGPYVKLPGERIGGALLQRHILRQTRALLGRFYKLECYPVERYVGIDARGFEDFKERWSRH
ncbi:hypothetical protein LZ554_004308 [Drepanopeziza brunnea f. sp. 'monogermtubi']|nr:hypothetical protein LZ554_004308 [Drepanopeziza brunnea f. sp. 'monogermtubi']